MKTKACNQALRETSRIIRCGCGWIFSYYEPSLNAWRESPTLSYSRAQFARRSRLIERATEILGNPMHVHNPDTDTGGRWQRYV